MSIYLTYSHTFAGAGPEARPVALPPGPPTKGAAFGIPFAVQPYSLPARSAMMAAAVVSGIAALFVHERHRAPARA